MSCKNGRFLGLSDQTTYYRDTSANRSCCHLLNFLSKLTTEKVEDDILLRIPKNSSLKSTYKILDSHTLLWHDGGEMEMWSIPEEGMIDMTDQGREIGYARVSKEEQNPSLQIDALKKHGVIRIFTDKQTGV